MSNLNVDNLDNSIMDEKTGEMCFYYSLNFLVNWWLVIVDYCWNFDIDDMWVIQSYLFIVSMKEKKKRENVIHPLGGKNWYLCIVIFIWIYNLQEKDCSWGFELFSIIAL